jgi:hypothetical protein
MINLNDDYDGYSETYFDFSEACDDRNLDVIKDMIRSGTIIPHERDGAPAPEGPLLIAVMEGDFEFVKELIEKYNVKNSYVLGNALIFKQDDIMLYLYELGSSFIEQDFPNYGLEEAVKERIEQLYKIKSL